MPFGIQPWHIVVIFVVALIIFGPSKLPELGRSVGKALNEFRNGARDMTDSFKEEIAKPDAKAKSNSPVAPVVQSQPSQTPPPAVSTDVGNFCTSCGSSNPADARFCKNCGKPLSA